MFLENKVLGFPTYRISKKNTILPTLNRLGSHTLIEHRSHHIILYWIFFNSKNFNLKNILFIVCKYCKYLHIFWNVYYLNKIEEYIHIIWSWDSLIMHTYKRHIMMLKIPANNFSIMKLQESVVNALSFVWFSKLNSYSYASCTASYGRTKVDHK